VCRVSHSDERPILFLPKPDREDSHPEGWVDIEIDSERFQAKFAKIAVNVLHRDGHEANILSDVLREWFGPTAGQPGTKQFVEFVKSGSGYTLAPIDAERASGPVLWTSYKRADVPPLFNVVFRGFEPQMGVVERPGLTFLFVTLDKEGQPEEHQYLDEFLSAQDFQWQSQNRTTQASDAGVRIRDHEALGIVVHLFVRPTKTDRRGRAQDFVYCGRLKFVSWKDKEAEMKPLTVVWRLDSEVPKNLRTFLRVPSQT
jgi:hypothetical protein